MCALRQQEPYSLVCHLQQVTDRTHENSSPLHFCKQLDFSPVGTSQCLPPQCYRPGRTRCAQTSQIDLSCCSFAFGHYRMLPRWDWLARFASQVAPGGLSHSTVILLPILNLRGHDFSDSYFSRGQSKASTRRNRLSHFLNA